MPVPKAKQKLYGKIVGHNINTGHSLADAKDIADRAIAGASQHGAATGKRGRKESASSKRAHKDVAKGAAF